MSRFTGFPEAALDFYEDLEADNSRTFWNAHRDTYERAVRAPMLDLLADLEPEFGTAKFYRPYRDLRFARDKTPYKTAAAAGVPGRYLQVSAAGLMVAGGLWHPATDQLRRQRRAIDDDVAGAGLERLLAELTAAGWRFAPERLRTRPRDYPADHPRIDLLRCTSLFVVRDWPPAGWLHTARARTRIRDHWRELSGLLGWLDTHVGASELPRERR